MFLFLVASQLIATGVMSAAGQQVLLIEVEEKTDGDKNGKDVKAEKKDGKECYAHPGFPYAYYFAFEKYYNTSAVRLIPCPVFETQTPPPNTTC